MQADTRTVCNVKVKISKHGTLAPTYKTMKHKFYSTSDVEHEFWYCHELP